MSWRIKSFIYCFVCITILNANETLQATIIGSGSPLYNENRASASVLISKENTNILLDMGNGTQANLHKVGINARKLSALLFTHHHLDHNEEFVPNFYSLSFGAASFCGHWSAKYKEVCPV